MATETRAGATRPGLPPSARATRVAPAGSGYLPSSVPHDLLAGVYAAHRRLLGLAATLDDETLARPSLLPGWTVGHVLTHLADDARGQADLVDTVAESSVTTRAPAAEPAPGRLISRSAAAGAGPSEAIRDDLATAIARLERSWDQTHVDVWRTGYGLTPGTGTDRRNEPVTLADLVFLRWREVEIHGIDLGLTDRGGPGWAGLPAPYVDAEWAWTTARLAERLPPGGSVLLAPGDRPSRAFGMGSHPAIVGAPTVETLRWLLGRLPGPATPREWPALRPWE